MKKGQTAPEDKGSRLSRRLHGPLTINDVAAHAGVSPMTVSRVINGEPNVRAAKREAVNASIQALNYAPNPAARSLAGANVVRIGLLYSNPSEAYLSQFLLGSLDQCRRDHVQLVVEKCDIEGREAQVATRLAATGVDGVILPPPLCDNDGVLKALAATNTPVVAVATGREIPSVSTVRIDDYDAARTMTRHLIEMGHHVIGFIKGHPNQTASVQRHLGYLAAMKDGAAHPGDCPTTQGYFTYHSGLDATEHLLSASPRPTAIFASNDDMAAAAIAVAHRRGLEVPGDLTVCGFDDSERARTIWPELTTIRQPITDMARRAVILLAEEIRGRRAGKAVGHVCDRVDFTLVRRQSDSPPSTQRPPNLTAPCPKP